MMFSARARQAGDDPGPLLIAGAGKNDGDGLRRALGRHHGLGGGDDEDVRPQDQGLGGCAGSRSAGPEAARNSIARLRPST